MAPKRKAAKRAAKQEPPPAVSDKREEEEEERPPPSKKAKQAKEKVEEKKKTPPAKKGRKASPRKKVAAAPPKPIPKVIIIESSKEDKSFKAKATKVESGLKNAIPELEIKLNPQKPRKGCFEIRDEEGSVFFSLQNLSKPYTKLKDIDVDSLVRDISTKVEST